MNRKLYCQLCSSSASNPGQELPAEVEESRGHIHPSNGVTRSSRPSYPLCWMTPLIELRTQILETLHPIDLYHITLTTRALRKLLLSRSASAIWENSFKAYSEIPFYPKDVSAPRWASLLFGPATCDVSLVSLIRMNSEAQPIVSTAAELTRRSTLLSAHASATRGAR